MEVVVVFLWVKDHVSNVDSIVVQAKKFTVEFIASCRREARTRQISLSTQMEGSALTAHPEYVLFFLVYALAHHPKYPFSVEASSEAVSYEPFQRFLMSFQVYPFLCSDVSCFTSLLHGYASVF